MIDHHQSLNLLMMMFPLAKFEYLRERVLQCVDDDDFEDLVDSLVEHPTYPQKEVTRAEDESDNEFRIEPFDVADFLKEYMNDPLKHFAGLNRDMHHKALTLDYLKKRFKSVREDYIKMILQRANFNLMEAADALRNPPASEILPLDRLSGDLPGDLDATNWPINFKREVQFFEHKSEVMEYLEIVKEMKAASIEEKTNLSCECCYEDDILNEEALACQGGHIFCVSCVIRHIEADDNKPDLFKCIFFQFCSYRFTEEILQKCFKPTKLIQMKNNWQRDLLRRADIEGLEFCPFCDYAAIADRNDLVFICSKCSIKSCRRCRRAYHAPLDCGASDTPAIPVPVAARNPPGQQKVSNQSSPSSNLSSGGSSGYSSLASAIFPDTQSNAAIYALLRNTPSTSNTASSSAPTAKSGAIPKQTATNQNNVVLRPSASVVVPGPSTSATLPSSGRTLQTARSQPRAQNTRRGRGRGYYGNRGGGGNPNNNRVGGGGSYGGYNGHHGNTYNNNYNSNRRNDYYDHDYDGESRGYQDPNSYYERRYYDDDY